MRRRRLFGFCLAAVCALGPMPVRAAPVGLPRLDVIDPPRYAYGKAIVEHQLITARDGITTLAVDIIRPKTAARVPTILIQSPYYNTAGRGWKHELKTHWGTTPPPHASGSRTPFPEWYDEYFVPRGYAVALQDQRGTRNSSGCQVYGGREEITDAVDVIDWLEARPWSNGNVGMIGGSYDGTIAVGAASMAPRALKAIIPIRSIDRWYDYHFFNGLQSEEHLATPWSFTTATPPTDNQSSLGADQLYPVHVIERRACAASIGVLVSAQYSTPYQDARSAFWASRDFVKDASRIRAAVFLIHGLNDTNVKTINAGHLWEALPRGTRKKMWLLRGGHDDPANPDVRHPQIPFVQLSVEDRFVEWTHRWFARFLKGLPSGALDAPPVSVQGQYGGWWEAPSWPPPATDVRWWLTPDGLRLKRSRQTLSYADGGAGPDAQITLRTPPMKRDLRIAGQPIMHLGYSLAAAGDTTFAYRLVDEPSGYEIASGYARGAYRNEILGRGPSWPTLPQHHLPGIRTEIAFPFVYTDYVLPKGHRLALIVRADDGRVLGGGTGETVTLHLDDTYLVLPDSSPLLAEHRRARRRFS